MFEKLRIWWNNGYPLYPEVREFEDENGKHFSISGLTKRDMMIVDALSGANNKYLENKIKALQEEVMRLKGTMRKHRKDCSKNHRVKNRDGGD